MSIAYCLQDDSDDRLSHLPDFVLLHILSFLDAKQTVQTSILSTRWKNLWKFLPTIKLKSSYFDTLVGFTQFTTKILSLRDSSTALYYLRFSIDGLVEPPLLESILNCAVSQNLRLLRITLLYNISIPGCVFSCHTLTSLQLYVRHSRMKPFFPTSLNLPALTTLRLSHFVFRSGSDGRAEPFSALKKLNRLLIRSCEVFNEKNLCISSVTLTNLTIQTRRGLNYRKIELCTPNLSTFAYAGIPFEKICGSHLCSIEDVNVDAYMCSNIAEPPLSLLSWLIELTEIKSLTVTSTTLQVLSLVPNLLEVKFHSLRNLKSLKVKTEGISSESSKRLVDGKFLKLSRRCQKEVAKFREAIFKEGTPAIPNIIDGFLVQNSPSAKISYH